MKVAICLLLCLCALQVVFSNSKHISQDTFRQDPCVDDCQNGNINAIGNVENSSPSTGPRRRESNWNGYEETSPQSTEIEGPDHSTNGNVGSSLPPTGVRRQENNRSDNVQSSSKSIGASGPEINANGNVETSSPPTGVTGPEPNETIVEEGVPKRLIQVRPNCGPGYIGDFRGNCRENI